MSNNLKVKPPKGGVTVFFGNGTQMTAPSDVWIACMLEVWDELGLTKQGKEKLIRAVQATMDKMKHGIAMPYKQVGVMGADGKPKMFQ